ncbi:Hypothetical_protein [Hexamita inflata]|uniref:Hypothetical_protein n=1 Tax=Hexamita inflata TaxID=28002 RepID=A0ABP1J6C9_9EUKA
MKSQYNEGTTISSPPFEAEFVKKSAYSVSDKSLTAKRSLAYLKTFQSIRPYQFPKPSQGILGAKSTSGAQLTLGRATERKRRYFQWFVIGEASKTLRHLSIFAVMRSARETVELWENV